MVFTNAPMMTALSGNCIDLPSIGLIPEVTLIAKAEIEQVNHTELVTALDILIGAQRSNTKYKALNLQTDITIEQKKVLERVFDILCSEESEQANSLVTKIIREFVPKSTSTTH